MIAGFALGNERGLGRQDRAAALEHLQHALTAGAATATSRRHENAGIGEAAHELAADRQFQVLVVVDVDVDGAFRDEPGARREDDEDQDQDDRGKKRDAQSDFEHD